MHLWNYADRGLPGRLGAIFPDHLAGRHRARWPRWRACAARAHRRAAATARSPRSRPSPACSAICLLQGGRRARLGDAAAATAASAARRGARIRAAGDAAVVRDHGARRRRLAGLVRRARRPGLGERARACARRRRASPRRTRSTRELAAWTRERSTRGRRRDAAAARRPVRPDAHRHRPARRPALRGPRLSALRSSSRTSGRICARGPAFRASGMQRRRSSRRRAWASTRARSPRAARPGRRRDRRARRRGALEVSRE